MDGPGGKSACQIRGDGAGSAYRMQVLEPSFISMQTMPHMMRGGLVADAVAVISSVDPVLGEVDR